MSGKLFFVVVSDKNLLKIGSIARMRSVRRFHTNLVCHFNNKFEVLVKEKDKLTTPKSSALINSTIRVARNLLTMAYALKKAFCNTNGHIVYFIKATIITIKIAVTIRTSHLSCA